MNRVVKRFCPCLTHTSLQSRNRSRKTLKTNELTPGNPRSQGAVSESLDIPSVQVSKVFDRADHAIARLGLNCRFMLELQN